MPEILEYEDDYGISGFGAWFSCLDASLAAKIRRHIGKLGRGLRPDVEPVGEGVFETKLHFGPGYRVYFGIEGDELIILLAGGDKRSQDRDIINAKDRWAEYKARRRRTTYYAINP
jgi:putative addiction module killer protein